MTREQVRKKVFELTRELSDDEIELLVNELLSSRRAWTLSNSDVAELDRRSAEMDRGLGVVVEDIDGFIDDLDPSIDA